MADNDDTTYVVVANHEEQYSIWPEFKDVPAGWIAVGTSGPKDKCLEYVELVWTDMRPKSLRDKMEKDGSAIEQIESGVRDAVEKVLAEHNDRVEEYAAGQPELYGWFVARVIEAGDDVAPESVRAALNKLLPPHKIPSEYA